MAWFAAVLIVLWEWHVAERSEPRRGDISIDPGEILILPPGTSLVPWPQVIIRE